MQKIIILFLLTFSLLFCSRGLASNAIPKGILRVPVRIYFEDASIASGLFYVNIKTKEMYLVTPKQTFFATNDSNSLKHKKVFAEASVSGNDAKSVRLIFDLEKLVTQKDLLISEDNPLIAIQLTHATSAGIISSEGIGMSENLPLLLTDDSVFDYFDDLSAGDDSILMGFLTAPAKSQIPNADFKNTTVSRGAIANLNPAKKIGFINQSPALLSLGGPVIHVQNVGTTKKYHIVGLITAIYPESAMTEFATMDWLNELLKKKE